jgi:ABC-type dipeptide/oligopeptide/nickel transport system ATPase component
MQSGRIVETGPVRSIFHHAEHPYTESLLAAILDEGPARAALGTRAPQGSSPQDTTPHDAAAPLGTATEGALR